MRLPLQLKTPLRSYWSVAGNDTETLWWPVKQNVSNEKKKILFFIPGNPGLVEYYTDFLEEIHRNVTFPLEIFAGKVMVSEKRFLFIAYLPISSPTFPTPFFFLFFVPLKKTADN